MSTKRQSMTSHARFQTFRPACRQRVGGSSDPVDQLDVSAITNFMRTSARVPSYHPVMLTKGCTLRVIGDGSNSGWSTMPLSRPGRGPTNRISGRSQMFVAYSI
jgi:hypothetical protein